MHYHHYFQEENKIEKNLCKKDAGTDTQLKISCIPCRYLWIVIPKLSLIFSGFADPDTNRFARLRSGSE